MTPPSAPPLVWKLPAWQPAVLFVLTAAGLAITIYSHTQFFVRFLCLVIAVALLVGGIIAARAYLVVDDDGIGWRRLMRETAIPWAEVDSLQVHQTKLRVALAVRRTTEGLTEIPSVLVMPSKPMKNPDVVALLNRTARDIEDRRPPWAVRERE